MYWCHVTKVFLIDEHFFFDEHFELESRQMIIE